MSRSFTLLLAVGTSIVNGLAFDAPQATQDAIAWGKGFSPAPTSVPNSPGELVKRHLLEGRDFDSTILVGADQTCGYLNGNAGKPDTTRLLNQVPNKLGQVRHIHAEGSHHRVISSLQLVLSYGVLQSVVEWKAVLSNSPVSIRSSMLPESVTMSVLSTHIPSSGMSTLHSPIQHRLTDSSTGSEAPYCNTAVWPKEKIRDVYCAVRSVSTTQTILTTYSGQTIGGRFTQTVLPDLLDTTSSTRIKPTRSFPTSSSSSSSFLTRSSGPQSTTSGAPYPTPIPIPDPPKSTPIGPIVGGVIGGVAVLAAVAFGIWFMKRKKRNDKAAAVDNYGHQPPPVYHPQQPEIDGTGVMGKPTMTETQHPYSGAFVPAGASKSNDYQNQNQPPQQYQAHYNDAGAVSPSGTAAGTFNPRRDSTLSPVSPNSHNGSIGGSPQMTTRESYISSDYPSPAPPAVGAPAVHEMPGSAIGRKPVGNRSGVGNAT